jgi:hypothetical protein
MGCGRQPGGERVGLLGPCPAAIYEQLDGVNNGDAAGRFCWTLEGTLCPGVGEERIEKCFNCPFFHEVTMQEGESFLLGFEIPDKKV